MTGDLLMPGVPAIALPADLPVGVRALCVAFLQGLRAALADKLYAVYVYGALAFPEGGATGDMDVHVILKEPPDDGERVLLDGLHAALARDHPPLGADLDVYYLLLADARRPSLPEHQLLPGVVDDSWALHRAHILAGRCFVLYGPDPGQIYPPASWAELERALEGELDYVARHLDEYPAYGTLNLCRLMYSYRTRDVVVSKRASAEWAHGAYPGWRPLVEAAERAYDGKATARDRDLLQAQARAFFDFAVERIREAGFEVLDGDGSLEKVRTG